MRLINRRPGAGAGRILALIPFVLVLGAYLVGSAARLAENPNDKLLPSLASLGAALQRFLQHRGERLPVVESAARPLLLGVVSKSALLATYVRLSDQNPMA